MSKKKIQILSFHSNFHNNYFLIKKKKTKNKKKQKEIKSLIQSQSINESLLDTSTFNILSRDFNRRVNYSNPKP